METPVTEFLKLAREVKVRGHTRSTDQGVVTVKPHDRDLSEEEAAKLNEQTHLERLRKKQEREIQLWKDWKEAGESPQALRPLLHSFQPMIRSKVNTYKGRVKLVPDAAIEAEFQLRFVDALRNYDPSKGSLGTYVYRYLDKAKRFIVENQNIGRIPENRVYKIKQFQVAKESLTNELGEEPTVKQIAERLDWDVAETDRMDSELRNDLLTQGFEDDPYAIVPSKTEEVLRLFRYELDGKEREVYEYLVGEGRDQVLSTGDIAKRVGLKDYQVSRIKMVIQKKLRRYLDE